jgi:hypothetical protein
MDIVRMGIPSLVIIYIFFQKSKPNNTIHLYASILLFAVLMNLSFLIGQKLLPNIAILNNIAVKLFAIVSEGQTPTK